MCIEDKWQNWSPSIPGTQLRHFYKHGDDLALPRGDRQVVNYSGWPPDYGDAAPRDFRRSCERAKTPMSACVPCWAAWYRPVAPRRVVSGTKASRNQSIIATATSVQTSSPR